MVIKIVCLFWFNLSSKVFMFEVLFWLRFLVGLLVRINCGCNNKVFVMVICCCLLLESFVGWCFFWLVNLICLINLLVCLICDLLVVFLVIVGIKMFFSMDSWGSRWCFWKIKLMFWLWNVERCLVLRLKGLILFRCIELEVGLLSVLRMCKSVFLLELFGLSMVILLFGFNCRLIFDKIWSGLFCVGYFFISDFIFNSVMYCF